MHKNVLKTVHGKTTYKEHKDDIRVYGNDIQKTYEYMRVTYGWHKITYE